MIDYNRYVSKIDQFCIKIPIVDRIKIVEIRIVVIQRSKSTALESESSSIRLWDPNCISLQLWCKIENVKRNNSRPNVTETAFH